MWLGIPRTESPRWPRYCGDSVSSHLTKIGMSLRILVKLPNLNFLEILFSCSQFVMWWWMDRGRFSFYCFLGSSSPHPVRKWNMLVWKGDAMVAAPVTVIYLCSVLCDYSVLSSCSHMVIKTFCCSQKMRKQPGVLQERGAVPILQKCLRGENHVRRSASTRAPSGSMYHDL